MTGNYIIPVFVKDADVLVSAEFESPKKNLQSHETVQTTLEAYTAGGDVVSADNAKIYYTTSDAGVVEVSQTGLLTAKKPGSAEIIVYIQKGDILLQRNLIITVHKRRDRRTGSQRLECGFWIIRYMW